MTAVFISSLDSRTPKREQTDRILTSGQRRNEYRKTAAPKKTARFA